jgi:hypothetical protein
MTNVRLRHHTALDGFAVLALVITFLVRYTPFLASHLLFGPFIDNVHIYGPIFSEVSRLASAGAVPYYLPNIGTGFPVFESPHFSILYPFYFFGLLNYGGPLASLYTLTNLTLLHIFVFYLNLYLLLRCATITPWASYIGASVGMLARNTELYASWITITASYAWLPLVLAGGVLLLRFPGKTSDSCVFHCGGPAGTGEFFPASDSRGSNMPDFICDRHCVVVSSATLRRRLARSLVPGGVQWHRLRTGGGRDTPNVRCHG